MWQESPLPDMNIQPEQEGDAMKKLKEKRKQKKKQKQQQEETDWSQLGWTMLTQTYVFYI